MTAGSVGQHAGSCSRRHRRDVVGSSSAGGVVVWTTLRATGHTQRAALDDWQVQGKLFRDILSNPHHTLHHLLREQTTHKHQLRTRRHDRQLLCKSKFDDSNFITRLLFYCFLTTPHHHPSSVCCVSSCIVLLFCILA